MALITMAAVTAAVQAGKAAGIDVLRMLGTKDYPPGGDLYNMFKQLGYDVDLDILGGTKNAFHHHFKKFVEQGVETPELVQFRTSTWVPPTNNKGTTLPPVDGAASGSFAPDGTNKGTTTIGGMSPVMLIVIAAAAYFILKKKR